MHKRAVLALALLFVAAGCSREGRVKHGIATDEGIAAIASPEGQYRDLLKRSYFSTQSGPVTLGILGLDEGCAVLDSAVDAVVSRNLPKWRANLIAAYRSNVSPDQLAEAVQKSPRRARAMLAPQADAIGSSMRQLSLPLLENSTVEVMGSTFAAANRIDRVKRDMATRQRDVATISASDEICGVRKWQRK